MPIGRTIGIDNSAPSGRVIGHDRSARFERKPMQNRVRRSLDGFALPPAPAKTKLHASNSLKPIVKTFKAPTSVARMQTNIKPALPRQAKSAVLVRHAVRNKPKKLKAKTTTRNTHVSNMLVAMAVMVFMGGATVTYLGWKTNREAAAQVAVLASTSEDEGSDVPTEDEVTTEAVNSYQVAPDMPRLITIPRLEVSARIKRLGVKASGELNAPSNINDAGWYEGSSKPGENGTVLIDGHVHGPSKPGVFYRLNKLVQGDTIEIERGDNKTFSYKVVSTEIVDQDKVDMTKALTSVEPGKPGLNLISCTGGYDVRTNTYQKRLIVYAVQQ